MMNVEADVTVGAIMQDTAARKGLVYTVGAGDEPSSVMEMYDWVTALGYPVVAAGKGKNNAFKIDAVPDDYREEAERQKYESRECWSNSLMVLKPWSRCVVLQMPPA